MPKRKRTQPKKAAGRQSRRCQSTTHRTGDDVAPVAAASVSTANNHNNNAFLASTSKVENLEYAPSRPKAVDEYLQRLEDADKARRQAMDDEDANAEFAQGKLPARPRGAGDGAVTHRASPVFHRDEGDVGRFASKRRKKALRKRIGFGSDDDDDEDYDADDDANSDVEDGKMAAAVSTQAADDALEAGAALRDERIEREHARALADIEFVKRARAEYDARANRDPQRAAAARQRNSRNMRRINEDHAVYAALTQDNDVADSDTDDSDESDDEPLISLRNKPRQEAAPKPDAAQRHADRRQAVRRRKKATRGPPRRRDQPRQVLENPITNDEMNEGVVKPAVRNKYLNEVLHFSEWAREKKPEWFTEYGLQAHDAAFLPVEGEGINQRWQRKKENYRKLMQAARRNPVFKVDEIPADGVMEYISIQCNQKTGEQLSPAGYSGKRSSILNMVRDHNVVGWSREVDLRLKHLWKGFTRCSASRVTEKTRKKRTAGATGHNSDGSCSDDDDRDMMKEGKVPMTPELFKSMCKWFLEWGNVDAIFAAFFLSLTWNLNCRANNTAKLRFTHLSWEYFDCMHVKFRHTKTEQTGTAKRTKRAIYSNLQEPNVNVVFLFGLYLATAFNEKQDIGSRLFPGSSDSVAQRFSDLMKTVLVEHEKEVRRMGFPNIDDIGTHSIRKGVSTYLASLPGGPPPAALSVRGGWSMGQVKDIYFDHSNGGDEFTGRCACLLNMMDLWFSVSPAFFDSDKVDPDEIQDLIDLVFPNFRNILPMQKILEMCLAALVFFKEVVMELDPNHVGRQIPIFRDTRLIAHIGVSYATCVNEELTITGVPPHIRQLAELMDIRDKQQTLVEDVTKELMEELQKFFDDRSIGASHWTEKRMRELVSDSLSTKMGELQRSLKEHVDLLAKSFGRMTDNVVENNDAGPPMPAADDTEQPQGPVKYKLRPNGHGGFTRLPADFQFPREGPLDLWIRWKTPDRERLIPPLQDVKRPDWIFLESEEKTESELRGATGKSPEKRRHPSKTYSDIKFLCNKIEKAAEDSGLNPKNKSADNLQWMYEVGMEAVVPDGETSKARFTNCWNTLVKKLRQISAKANGGTKRKKKTKKKPPKKRARTEAPRSDDSDNNDDSVVALGEV